MYCRNCGAEISDDSKFCNVCGEQVEISKKNNIGDTQEIIIPKSEFMNDAYDEDSDDGEIEEYEYKDNNYEKIETKKSCKKQDNNNDFIKKHGKKVILTAGGVIIGIGIALMIMKLGVNSSNTNNVAEVVEAKQETNTDTESKKQEVKEEIVSKDESSTTSSESKDKENKEEKQENSDNPNEIPRSDQVNYKSNSMKNDRVKFEYPSFFSISSKTDEYINLKTNNSDALMTVTVSNHLPEGCQNAQEKHNYTIDKLEKENAQIVYKNLSRRESVVSWKKDGIAYYQCDRYDKKGKKSDSFVVSYPVSQEKYYYDVIQYIYDKFDTTEDLK